MRPFGSEQLARQRPHPLGRARSGPSTATATVPSDGASQPPIVHRPRLHHLLGDAERLTVVAAPSGYGKTSLVRSWTRGRAVAGDVVAWLQPEAGAESFGSFGRALRRALIGAGALPASTAGAAELWETWSPGSGWAETERLLAARSETAPRLVIVIDRGERLTSARLWDALERLTRRAHRASLVAVIRTDRPDSGTPAAMRRDRHALAIGPAELLFDLSEIDALAGAMGMSMPPAASRAVLEATGGCPWLVGTVLDHYRRTGGRVVDAAIVRDSAAAAGGDRARRLVEQLSPIAPLALLDGFGTEEVRLCHELAHDLGVPGELGADPDGHRVVHHLHDLGMLQRSRDGNGHTSRWHLPLVVKELLLDRLDSFPPEVLSTTSRALAEQLVLGGGSVRQPEAARLARLGEHWDLLAAIWRDRKVEWRAGHLSEDLARSFVDLPAAAVAAAPELRATRYLSAPHVAARPGWMLSIEPAGPGESAQSLAGMPSADSVIGEAADGAISARRRGRWKAAQRMLKTLDEDLCRRRRLGEQEPSPLAQGYLELQRGLTGMVSGAEVDAVEPLSRAASSRAGSGAVQAAASAMVELLHRRRLTSAHHAAAWRAQLRTVDPGSIAWVDLARAVSDLWVAMDQLSPAAAPPAAWDTLGPEDHPELYPFVVEARVRWQLTYGDVAHALGRLEGLGLVPSTPTGDAGAVPPSIQRAYVDALIGDGQLNRAESFMRTAGSGDPVRVPWFRVARARLALTLGRCDDAVQLARIESRRLDVSSRDRCELRLIEAAAQLELGEEEESVRIFRDVRGALNRLGAVHPYATLPRPALEALSSEVPVGAAAAWMLRSWVPERYDYVQLSERERVVLDHLVTLPGASQIAGRLVVSPNTVKKQLTSLYTKLGVHSRAEALRVAEHLGLVPARATTSTTRH